MKKNTKSTILKSSIATTLALASISPIAVALGKQIIDNHQNKLFNDLSRQTLAWDQFPNINQPTKSMFTNTSNIKDLGNLGKGIPLTPYGWLATYNQQTPQKVDLDARNWYWDNTAALIGWDGSIIWATNTDEIRNYNSKYNFSNDVIFSLRTQDYSGAGRSNSFAEKTHFKMIDAKTGKQLRNNLEPWYFSDLFTNTFLHNYESNGYELIWTEENKKDLYFQDFVTLSNGDIIWYYLPNPLKFRVKNKRTNEIKNLISMDLYTKAIIGNTNIINSSMAKCFYIKKQDIDSAKENDSVMPIIDITQAFFDEQFYSWPNAYLITAPIVCAGNNNKFKIMFYVVDSTTQSIKVINSVWQLNNNALQHIGGSEASITNNLLGFDLFNRGSAESNNHVAKIWESSQWTDEFNKSLLIPTRNMFDENTITFAYPYAAPGTNNTSSIKVPIFNVATLSFEKNSLDNLNTITYNSNKSKIFNFGTKIITKYINDKGWNKDPINDSVTNLLWYPWPGSHSSINNYTNQLYSRLISVSPFDNSIIYASRPDNKKISGNRDIFVGLDSNKNDYASFWIGNSSSGNIKNFYIPNSTSIFGSAMSNELVSSTDFIYNIGFWFDIYSLSITNSNSVNLYFLPKTGTKYNQKILGNSNDIKSSPIGVVRPLVSNSKPMDTLTNTSNENFSSITNKSYTNYITSRADLTQWFNRTYIGISKGANTYKNNDVLNDYNTSDKTRVTVDEQFSKITNATYNTNNKSIELYLYWNIGDQNAYNSMPVKRAKIVPNVDTSIAAEPVLNAELQFILENNNWNNIFLSDTDKPKVTTFKYPVTINNASWQLLDSWSTNYKVSTLTQNQNNNSINVDVVQVSSGASNSTGNYGSSFGTHNIGYWYNNPNAAWTYSSSSGITNETSSRAPLRLELGINYDPNNNADSTWKNALESYENGKFTKTYPINSKNSSDPTFNKILNDFIQWKASNIMYGDLNNPTNNIYSPGQIVIQAYLKLNPDFDKFNNTIYTLNNGIQMAYDSNLRISYIYDDQYKGTRFVYKQTSPTWDENNQYGFGSQVTNEISPSWNNTNVARNNLVAYLNANTSIKDTLVRDTNITTNQMFTVKYNEDLSSIILTPETSYLDWIKKRFSSYNQMVGRYITFQYLLVGERDESSNWKSFNNNILKDSEAKTMFDSGSYTIPFSNGNAALPKNIQKIRFALYSLPTNDAQFNNNRIISSKDITSNRAFLSDAIPLDQIPVNIDYQTLLQNKALNVLGNDMYLGASNFTADTLNTAATTYQESVLSTNPLKEYLELKYSLEQGNSSYYDAQTLFTKLQQKYQNYSDPDQGIIDLWTTSNQQGNTKIYVKVVVKQGHEDKYEIKETNVNSNYIQDTNIKFFLNLKEWFNVLKTKKTNVILNSSSNQVNAITSFTPPEMTGQPGQGFLFGKSYDDVVTLLKKFGVKVEYQKTNSNWTEDKNEITSYDISTRKINVRFSLSSGNSHNVVISGDGTNVINNPEIIGLQLNVPILVNLNEATKNNFIKKDHISGNTWTINIDQTKEQTIINDIKSDQNGQWGTDPVWQELPNYLEVQYALSNNNPDASTIFRNRENLINHLKEQTETNYNNTIWAHLHIKTVEGEDAKFILSSAAAQPFKMNNTTIGSTNVGNSIKIYVQAAQYEQGLNQIEAIGSTGKLQLSYPEIINQVINDSTNLGIKIQYSLKQDINYGDASGTDINTSWVDTAPTSVPVGTPSIKVKITTTNQTYEYGMGNTPGSVSVHSIDLTNIASLIDVDSTWFGQEALTVSANGNYLKDIQESDITDWKDKILNKSKALQADASLKSKVEIKFKIENNDNWYDAQGLVTELKAMINNYAGDDLGIIYLWDGSRGLKITAQFEKANSDDKIIFVDTAPDSTTPNTNLSADVKTDQIKTYVDLSSYITVLTTKKTSVVLRDLQPGTIASFTPPAMDGTSGQSFLSGKTYDQIATRLQALGITFKFNTGLTGDNDWNTKENVNSYNTSNPILYLGFQYDTTLSPNITIKINNNSSNNEITSTKLEQNLVTLKLLAPVAITVNLTDLNQLAFEGNTKTISNANNIQTKVSEIINQVKKPLQDNGTDINDLNLEIRFSLNNLPLEETISDSSKTEDGIWFTFDKLNEILSQSTTNYNTNSVFAKFYIKDNPQIEGVNKYILSNTGTQNINQENLTSSSNFKVYINNTNETQEPWITENLKLVGSQENFTITNLETWLNDQLPAGLEVQYNAVASTTDKTQPDESSWKTTYSDASPIDSLRNYWIRFKVKDAYVFEGAQANNASYSQAFKLDASQIQVALKIQSSWLEKIALSGNLKDLTIDEQLAITEITNANMMPVNNIIQIEYSYNDAEWLTKDQFINQLQQLAGAKDSTNWIILREDIKARFALNTTVNSTQNPKYLLEVDGTNINEDNSNNTSKQLITSSLNNSVKGYINLDKLTTYQASNFSVTGTDTEAYLNIKKHNDLNNLLSPYSSNNLFSIQYKYNKNSNYEDSNKVWTPGQQITSPMLLNGTYQDRYFAMQFKVTDSNYELYQSNIKQTDNTLEYSTDATDNNKKIDIKISVAITNPLSSNEINIKFLDAASQPYWYNGQGAFQLVIEKSGATNQGTLTYNSFSDFLYNWASTNGWSQDQRDALELVYYVAKDANDEEKAKAINALSTYNQNSIEKYNVWKTVSEEKILTNLNYNLKVNDYVILAVRIKEEKLTSDSNPNGYVLKDNNHSPTDQIRAFGYKVHTDYIDVDWASLKVRNVDAAESASYGLDGYAMLDQISLKRSTNSSAANTDDYLNVSLQLNYFTEFYYDNQDQVLVSGDGSRLVKREQTNSEQDGYYKNADGQDITDKDGNKVPILYKKGQKDNGILAKPIKASSIQRQHGLVETTSNIYTLELNSGESNALYSFFKFQDIAIQFVNKKGYADPNNPDEFDYYVDNQDVAKEYEVNSQIKFPIENNKLINYTFNSEEFINYIKDPNNINSVYENTLDSTKSPVNGQSKIKHMYKVIRKEGQNATPIELTTIESITNKIKEDFGSKVILKTTYTPVNGASQNISNNDLSSITSLSNGDRFRIEIVSADENNLIFAQQPSPLVFTISGLYEADIEEQYLQYLRVQQSGNFNGEGQFEIFVDNPYDDQDNHLPISTLLQGYKFMVRVWDSNKNIKKDWTNDFESINNLSNGDKVEWKLVAPTGAPVEKAYYNTIANIGQHDTNNNTYSFSQVAKVGNTSTNVVSDGIGRNPTNDAYPENTGLLISGLPEKISDTYTSITEEEFIRLMNIMNFGYTGINGQGNMISDRDINNIIVNTSSATREKYNIKYLIDQGYITFYSNNIEFSWNQVQDNDGNWLISPGTLSNGDQITIKYADPTMSSSYSWAAPEVSGLKDKSDSMSLLAYVGIGVASFATLGIFAIIYFVARNKKLRK